MEDTESTNTSLDDKNEEEFYENSARTTFSDGLMGLLRPAIEQLDERVRLTRISQLELRQQIDSLSDDLRKISDTQQIPLDFDVYVKKLMNAKRRVMMVNNILQNAQERLNRVHQTIAKETARRKSLLDSTLTATSTSSLP
uniref:Biogenesis of lysosome-related organelles complex 1 subunit 7 n=1 Tax=Strigamia maritima TaxID=126957 RepID=T1JIU4_STRMM